MFTAYGIGKKQTQPKNTAAESEASKAFYAVLSAERRLKEAETHFATIVAREHAARNAAGRGD